MTTRFLAACLAASVGLFLLQNGARAEAAANESEAAEKFPWDEAQEVLKATEADVSASGIPGIRMHVADLERVLTGTRASYSRTYETDGTTYVLTDGMSEALVAMTMYSAATDKSRAKGKVVAINNPYPMISFYLGTYYNEIGRPEDALRVLDAGLGLPPVMTGLRLGDSIPLLIRERGAALFSLKRWQEALENFDDGLTIESLEDPHRAGLLRGRGFALIELGRLDEAETMYQESLKLEPNNAIAKQELEYIAKLRAGGKKQPSELILQGQPKN